MTATPFGGQRVPTIPARASIQARVRGSNRREVLQLVIDGHGKASRASIARATGLTSATISAIVAELIDANLVENAGLADSTGGKPATSLRIRTDQRGLGVMIVRRHAIRAAVIDLNGDVVVEIERFHTGELVTIGDILTTMTRLIDASPLPFLAIGVDSPGAIAQGVILDSVQLKMHDVHLQEELASIAPCSVYLINDADADALREYSLDPPEDGNLFLLALGVGVGGAFVLDGDPYPGPRSVAGELGHVRVDFAEDALECTCGRRGCLERLTALPQLLELESEDLAASDNPATLELPTSPEGIKRVELATQLMARTLITVCSAVNVHTAVIGGGAPRLGAEFLSALQRGCDELHPVGTERLTLRYARGAVLLPFRGGADHALRQALGVGWVSRPSTPN
ncbi:MAG: ROK family transcriptional regulator [Rhodoglobus sp.]